MERLKIAAGLLVVLLCTACAQTFFYDGKQFDSPAAAYGYQSRQYGDAIRAIPPLDAPVRSDAAVVLTSRPQIEHYQWQAGANIQPWQVKYLTDLVVFDQENMVRALRKRKIFETLEVIHSDGERPELSGYDAVLYIYWPEPETIGWFFSSADMVHEPVPISTAYPAWSERLLHWLDRIQYLADSR